MRRHESQSVREGCGNSEGIIMGEGVGGGRKQVTVGKKWRFEQRKTERSEESGNLTDVFIMHHHIPLMLTVTPSSVEDSHMRVLQYSVSMNIQMCQTVLCALVDSCENNIIPLFPVYVK